MYRHNERVNRPPGAFWGVVAGVMTIVAIGSVFVALWCSEASLKRVHREFNYVMVNEDGSYIGETRGGRAVEGCIQGAKCND